MDSRSTPDKTPPPSGMPHDVPASLASPAGLARPGGTAAAANPLCRPGATDVPEIHCVILLDRSLSMLMEDWPPNRLEAAREATVSYIRRLAGNQPRSRVAIVAFCGEVHTLCRFHLAADSDHFSRALAPVKAGMATNIGDGLGVANRMLTDVPGARHVLLLTDGGHNLGPEPLPLAVPLKTICRVQCIGIGQRRGINEPLLQAIASTNPDGSPAYRWIGSKEKLIAHLVQTADRITRC